MPSAREIVVRLTANVSGMVEPILNIQMSDLADQLASAGFEHLSERVVQHTESGVMIASSADGYRVSYYCPEARGGNGLIDLPLSTRIGELAHLALALHRAEKGRQ
jgi:hypothetical protein